jgi:cytochrome b6-f complex iron-sulfur subunit
MTRRDIIQRVLAGSVTLLVIPQVLTSCSKDEDDPDPTTNPPPGGSGDVTIDLNESANAILNSPGGSLIKSNILVINLGTVFSAVSSICTHEGCTVGYKQSSNIIQCPCHGSQYDTSGTVITGPAPRALKSYTVTREGDILTIK